MVGVTWHGVEETTADGTADGYQFFWVEMTVAPPPSVRHWSPTGLHFFPPWHHPFSPYYTGVKMLQLERRGSAEWVPVVTVPGKMEEPLVGAAHIRRLVGVKAGCDRRLWLRYGNALLGEVVLPGPQLVEPPARGAEAEALLERFLPGARIPAGYHAVWNDQEEMAHEHGLHRVHLLPLPNPAASPNLSLLCPLAVDISTTGFPVEYHQMAAGLRRHFRARVANEVSRPQVAAARELVIRGQPLRYQQAFSSKGWSGQVVGRWATLSGPKGEALNFLVQGHESVFDAEALQSLLDSLPASCVPEPEPETLEGLLEMRERVRSLVVGIADNMRQALRALTEPPPEP